MVLYVFTYTVFPFAEGIVTVPLLSLVALVTWFGEYAILCLAQRTYKEVFLARRGQATVCTLRLAVCSFSDRILSFLENEVRDHAVRPV